MINKFKLIITVLLGFHKTLIVNFKYFNFMDAIKLPILISNRVYLKKLNGKLIIDSPLKTGLIRIGFGDISIFDKAKSRTLWDVSGTIIFEGRAEFGHGSKISLGEKGNLKIGNNFTITAETQIISHKNIVIGKDVLISWQVLIMDTDFHSILDKNGTVINPNEDIYIGDNVWIGCRCSILKGSNISPNSIIAANSVITKSTLCKEYSILGGNPAKIIKNNVFWNK